MTKHAIDVERLLADADPVPTSATRAVGLDARARADLDAILTGRYVPGADRTPRSGHVAGRASAAPVRHTRRVVLTAAAVAAAAGVVFASGVVDLQGGQGASSAHAATPPPLDYQPLTGQDPTGVLNEIAARTASLPDDTGTGRYARTRLQAWYLWTEVDGGVVDSAVVPQDLITWKADDGSGRTVRTYTEPGDSTVVEDELAQPGELGTYWPLRSLSQDDITLAGQLEVGHPVANGPAGRLVAITDAYKDMPLTPGVRAALLRYLAATPTLQLAGAVTDRLGRTGIAVSLDSDHSGLPTRYTLIIDPRSGQLLGSEDMLTTTAGRLNVPIPSVISYEIFRGNRYVDSLG